MHSGQTRAERRAKRSTRRQLDALIVNIELTLTSIIQGVALSVLTESSRAPLGDLRFDQWPYVANGLLVILLFWSRLMAHTFLLIRLSFVFSLDFFSFSFRYRLASLFYHFSLFCVLGSANVSMLFYFSFNTFSI